MIDQNKKGNGQVVKRNTEEEQCQVYLEASLGISVSRFCLLDTIVGKGNKLGEGIKTESLYQTLRINSINFTLVTSQLIKSSLLNQHKITI